MIIETTELYKNLPAAFGALFLVILFIQSGLDKVFDWKGNLGWLTGHFGNTFLAKFVPAMLMMIAWLELITGITALIGLVYLIQVGSTLVIFIASLWGAVTITALFFGQRIAKDYPGAAVLVPYFLLMIVTMYLSSPYPNR